MRAGLAQLGEVARIAAIDRDRLHAMLSERSKTCELTDGAGPARREEGYKISGQLAFGRLLPADLAQAASWPRLPPVCD